MKTNSLFPDYSLLETGRTEAQAVRLAKQLHEVDLQMLVTDPDRRTVVARLRREGIADAMQLILLTEEEVLSWQGVGPVFVEILSSMRQQVVGNPERVVEVWHAEHRLYVLPDDLELQADDTDFFGTLLVSKEEAADRCDTSRAPSAGREGSDVATTVAELERCLVAAVEMMEHRARSGEVLRKYLLEGLPAETIVRSLQLPSAASLHRIVNKNFCAPLLLGYSVKGIQLSRRMLQGVKALRKQLLYAPASVLSVLTRMTPVRFLEVLELTLLQRTQAEAFWSGDYIVRQGEVERCRRTLHDLVTTLQFRVEGVSEATIRRSVQALRPKTQKQVVPIVPKFLRVLLHTHPCIESDRKGYRLASERLNYDCARLARIVYDAHAPIALADVLAQYERRYMQRPERVALANVRARFPQVHSISRGVWKWKKSFRVKK